MKLRPHAVGWIPPVLWSAKSIRPSHGFLGPFILGRRTTTKLIHPDPKVSVPRREKCNLYSKINTAASSLHSKSKLAFHYQKSVMASFSYFWSEIETTQRRGKENTRWDEKCFPPVHYVFFSCAPTAYLFLAPCKHTHTRLFHHLFRLGLFDKVNGTGAPLPMLAYHFRMRRARIKST